MDFISGLSEVEAASYDEPPPRNWVERFWSWLVSSFLAQTPERFSQMLTYRCLFYRCSLPCLAFFHFCAH